MNAIEEQPTTDLHATMMRAIRDRQTRRDQTGYEHNDIEYLLLRLEVAEKAVQKYGGMVMRIKRLCQTWPETQP